MNEDSSEKIQVVSFKLERESGQKEDYAVPIEQVKEIRTLEDVTQVPNAKSHVQGVMNLRGLIIPVIDVKTKLGFTPIEKTSKESQKILVAEVDNSLYGLLVDDVDQVMRLSPSDIDPAPPGTFEGAQYIKGIAKTENKLIVFLDVIPLINDSEDEIQEVSSVNQNIETHEPLPEKIESASIDDELPDELTQVLKEEIQV